MNASDILKKLNENNTNGSAYFTVMLPSLNKELKIRHLTINDQKIISKLSISQNEVFKFATESDISKIAFAETNSLEPINLESIDIRDFFILCCAIRKENYVDDLVIQYKCPQCEHEFDKATDFNKLIDNATEYVTKHITSEITSNLGMLNITLGIPTQLSLIEMEMYYDRVSKLRSISEVEKYIDFVICSIQSIEYKNDNDEYEKISDYEKLTYLEKVNLLNTLNVKIESLSKLFDQIGTITSDFFYNIECPGCKYKINSYMDICDFFIL